MRALLMNTRAHSTDAHARMSVEEGQSSKKPGKPIFLRKLSGLEANVKQRKVPHELSARRLGLTLPFGSRPERSAFITRVCSRRTFTWSVA